jgi:Flp pilus assembly protein TadG
MTGHRKQRGSQIVELGMVLPLLVFLAVGAAEGGSMVHVQQVVNNAAREGARLTTMQTVSAAANRDAVIQTAVQNYLTRNNVIPQGAFSFGQCSSWNPAGNVAVSSTAANTFQIPDPVMSNGNATLQSTKVTVTCPYRLFFLPRVSFFGVIPLTINLRGSAAMLNTN